MSHPCVEKLKRLLVRIVKTACDWEAFDKNFVLKAGLGNEWLQHLSYKANI